MAKRKAKLKPKEVEKHLRDYQLDGVDKMVNYIERFDNKNTAKSGLVAMPTGSGKTAIIASLACCLPRKGCILVLSPRRPVIDQLYKELDGNIFKKKFVGLKKLPDKPVFQLDFETSILENDAVVCWTIQRLLLTKKNKPKLFTSLVESVSLILFDEGHYEPAVQWSEAVRSFDVPRIIFTATPFRNDFKRFDIDWKKNVFRSKYSSLLTKKYLRKVNVQDLGTKANLNEAIKDSLVKYKKLKAKYAEARMIIKCDSSDTILAISNYLLNNNESFISIHETFTNSLINSNIQLKDKLVKSVPINQEELNIDIWVHQFKLIEGIDSNKFICLAIVEEITNSRSLIQQIGRIIRNPNQSNDQAYVYNYTEDNYESAWAGFLEIDDKDAIIQTLAEQVFENISSNLEDFSYVDKRIRSKLTAEQFRKWNTQELKENLQLPLKANFIEKSKGFDHKKFIDIYLDQYFKEKNHVFYKNIYGTKSGLYLYFNIQNSPYLCKTFFPQITHHICFFKEEPDYLIFFDSGSLLPLGLDELNLGYGLNPESLRGILKETSETVINRVALKSSDIGSKEPSSYSFISPSVEKTTPNLNDFSHFLSSTFGYYRDKKVYKDYKDKKLSDKEFQIPTYIGFSTGRISQNEGKYVKFQEYLDWIKYITKSIKSKSQPSSVFDRYTTEITNNSDPNPQCILLDVFDFENTHKIKIGTVDELAESEDNLISIIETFYLIKKYNGKYFFKVKINEHEYRINVLYDLKKNKFKLESDEIVEDLIVELRTENQKVISLIKSINRKQSFRILTKKGLSYSGGRFYEPHFKFGLKFDELTSPILKMMFPISELDLRFSEKGTKNGSKSDEWQNDSIFDLIDKRGKGTDLHNHFFEEKSEKEELLICTDLQTEPADFIYVSNKKIVFIHVKGKGNDPTKVKKSSYGASSISEICNQGVKNAHLLSIFDTSKPKNLNDWTKEWKLSETYKVKKRIRTSRVPKEINKTNALSIWEYIANKKLDVNVSKEIWLVMGYTFDKNKYIKAIGKKNPAAEAKQSSLTLESTLATIQSLGIKLKVFCS